MDRDQPVLVHRSRRTHASPLSSHRGAAIVEAIIALPILLIVILAAIQFGLIYQAKATLNHASLQAARAGAVSNASADAIRGGLARGLLPLFSPRHSSEAAAAATARIDAQLLTDARLRILNPTREAFADFAEDVDGQREIPNDRLHARSTTEGSASGLNVQDANVLKLEVTYGYRLQVPIVNWFISKILLQLHPTADLYGQQLLRSARLPILASATARMQSPARMSDLVVSRADLPNVRRVAFDSRSIDRNEASSHEPDGDLAEADDEDDRGGLSLGDAFLGFSGAHRPSVASSPDDVPKSTVTEPRDSALDSSATPLSPATEPQPLCTPTRNVGSDPDDDSGVLQQVWGELRNLAGTAVEFVRGFWEGIKSQLHDLIELITDPLEVAEGLYQLAREFIDDPPGTARLIGEALGKDLQQLVSCGAFDRGRVLGSNVDPAFMLKLATKLAKFGRLAHALDETKRAFGCASFTANTVVWTAGAPRYIDSIRSADQVTSRDRTTFDDAPHEVGRTFKRTAPRYYALVTEAEVLQVTAEHPLWVQGRGWTEVRELRPGDPIASIGGDTLVRETVPIESPREVFNFAVPGTESYFVGADGLWVHNANCEIPPIYRAPQSPSGYAIGASDGGGGSWRDVKRAGNTQAAEAAYRYQQQITGAPRNGASVREYRLGEVDFDGYDAERGVLIDAKHYTEFCPLADCKPEFLRGKVAQSLVDQAKRQIDALRSSLSETPVEWHVANREMAKKVEAILEKELSAEYSGRISVMFTPDLVN